VGVYGVFGGRGRGPWIETMRRVDGEDVSMYADPGAVVTRLVRRTLSAYLGKANTDFSRFKRSPFPF